MDQAVRGDALRRLDDVIGLRAQRRGQTEVRPAGCGRRLHVVEASPRWRQYLVRYAHGIVKQRAGPA